MEQERLKFITFSDRGVRRENEDYLVVGTVADDHIKKMNRGQMFMVADGIGGHRAGLPAARKICERLHETYYSADFEFDFNDPAAVEDVLKRLFQDVNEFLTMAGKDDPEVYGWGSTASLLIIGDDAYYFAHTGDSRIFLVREGTAKLLTEDQNVAYQMYKLNQIDYQEYLVGVGHNKLLSYIGVGDGISIQTGRGPFSPDDVFLLCSDGFNQFCQIHQLERLVENLSSERKSGAYVLDDLYRELTEELIETDKARDNVSFILVARE